MNIPDSAKDAAAGAISQMISGFLRRHEPLSAGQAATAALTAALPHIRAQIAADLRAKGNTYPTHSERRGAWHSAARVAEKGNQK